MTSKNISIPCRWQVTFRVKPSLINSETVDNYKFEVNDMGDGNKETCVTINYETTDAYDETSPGSDKYAENIMARNYASYIQNLLLERMIYQRVFGPYEITHSMPTLQNKNELENAGLWKPRNYVIHVEPTSLQIPHGSNSLTESHSFWKLGFQEKSNGYENDALRIADWLQRSEIEIDEIKSFILAWIAFNGLYGIFASINGIGDDNDANKVDYIIRGLLVNDAIDLVKARGELLDKLESYHVLSKNGNRDWSEELKTERAKVNNDYIKILQYAAKCIYGVRKQVFHEAPQSEDVVERAKICKLMLTPIVATCLKNFVIY